MLFYASKLLTSKWKSEKCNNWYLIGVFNVFFWSLVEVPDSPSSRTFFSGFLRLHQVGRPGATLHLFRGWTLGAEGWTIMFNTRGRSAPIECTHLYCIYIYIIYIMYFFSVLIVCICLYPLFSWGGQGGSRQWMGRPVWLATRCLPHSPKWWGNMPEAYAWTGVIQNGLPWVAKREAASMFLASLWVPEWSMKGAESE